MVKQLFAQGHLPQASQSPIEELSYQQKSAVRNSGWIAGTSPGRELRTVTDRFSEFVAPSSGLLEGFMALSQVYF